MTKLFQISEDDLATLEHILPEIMDATSFSNRGDKLLGNDLRLRKQWRDVRRIIADIRWNYGPYDKVDSVPAGNGDDQVTLPVAEYQKLKEIEEGDPCPEQCGGKMEVFVENCSCHLDAPCVQCLRGQLKCSGCGCKYEAEARRIEEKNTSAKNAYIPLHMQRFELGLGKVLFNCRMDSSSGSTMVYQGQYEGDVTADDIIKHFGDGTFGHRGPTISNGCFSYTKITD